MFSLIRRRAFTLVELLVVIGVIALLISMLLPALNKARQASQAVNCLSNLRQGGQALFMYSQENKSIIPHSALEYLSASKLAELNDTNNNEGWWTVLSRYTGKIDANGNRLSGSVMSNNKGLLPTGIWACPSIATEKFPGDTPNHFAANKHFFVGRADGGWGRAAPHKKMSAARPAAEKIAIVEYNMLNQDTRRVDFYSTTPELLIPVTFDKDMWRNHPDPSPKTHLRYRHNGAANALFFDGHAEPLKRGAVTYRMFADK